MNKEQKFKLIADKLAAQINTKNDYGTMLKLNDIVSSIKSNDYN